MQTFTPFGDFESSLRVLDQKRLGKQRVEVIQIVRALTVPGYAWSNHPAVLMWKGYEEALGRYGLVACELWLERGFGDTCAATITADLQAAGVGPIRTYEELRAAGALPPWLFDEQLQLSHRSALARKDPDHYRPVFGDVPADLPYVWPVRSTAVIEREQRQQENQLKREQRAAERLLAELQRAKRRRSAAAKKGWQTRQRSKTRPAPEQTPPASRSRQIPGSAPDASGADPGNGREV